MEFGKRSRPCDCEMTRVRISFAKMEIIGFVVSCTLNFQVQFPMDVFVQKFQPERYNDWINKKDIAPHPMDPPDVALSKRNYYVFILLHFYSL